MKTAHSAREAEDSGTATGAPGAGRLDDSERTDARERQSPSAHVIHEAIRAEAEGELERPPAALAWSGLAAGLSMGFSFVAEGLLHAHLPDAVWTPLVSSFGYTVGFLIVIIGRQQLFTENTLTPILPLLHEKNAETLWRVLRLWAVVLVTNLLGALAMAWVLGATEVFSAEVHHSFETIGREAIAAPFWPMLVGGIFAGWLIALMVWLIPFAESAHIWVVILIAYVVGLGGFAHIIAGSVESLYLVTTGVISAGTYFARFFAPALIGNIIGGVLLVAILNHAQVVAGDDDE